ncbi:hypothetical protein HETIRDRAFT_329543 [Heterobasidion irregulare TC 32-1]|uniref:Ribosomal RNA-processing protein 43 n=1 Tax=Heterobasidion irregulare (strain TC 32-1) TaxID=747525 RepID=W4JRD2_HETIT|nr:uncharacterized protein HETIRDRAFT_329543 [Heterobasidion irregulare TC 32-1]ETW75645.1 hypothetical protein HETIRDRAFT_329543 [Heterobasidion irregulare TC 32-1]
MAYPQTTTDGEQDHLKALVFQRLHPRIYLERFVAEDVRPDGRQFSERRDISVNVGSISSADGSSLVRLGNTTIVCGVKAEIAEPELDRPNEGFLVPNLDLPAMSSPKFKSGPPSEEAQTLSDRLNDVFVSSSLISLQSLCIHPGKAVWVLYVDATCINYDGNAFDAALIAMVSALKNTFLPKATFNEDTGRTTCSRQTKIPLQIQKLPTSSSFGVFDSSHIFADPTSFEEPLMDTTLSIVLDDNLQLISVTQLGLADSGTEDVLSTCIKIAKQHNQNLADRVYSV